MIRCQTLQVAMLGVGLAAMSTLAFAAPQPHAKLQAQVQSADAKVAAARDRNGSLQAQVTQLEQQTAAQKQQLQQRDGQIAALQEKLKAAGVPVSASSMGD